MKGSRISVRFSDSEREDLERAASVAGVATGALVRHCALRWGPVVAAEIAVLRRDPELKIVLRRRNG